MSTEDAVNRIITATAEILVDNQILTMRCHGLKEEKIKELLPMSQERIEYLYEIYSEHEGMGNYYKNMRECLEEIKRLRGLK